MNVKQDTRRKYIRVHFDRHVNLEFISDSYDHCPIKNLSLAGMFIMGNFQQQEGTYCLVNLIQKGISTDLSLRASAKVVRKDDEGVAIEFTSMPFESYLILQITLLSENENNVIIEKLLTDECPFEVTDQLPDPTKTNSSFI